MATRPQRCPQRCFASLLCLGLLASCQGSSGPGSHPVALNLAVASVAFAGEGDLWLVVVRESDQGGRDLNEDGDALDDVVHLLDLETGALTDARLATTGVPSPRSDAPPWLAGGSLAAAFEVSEACQGSDLNGDGDTADRILHVYARSTGLARNLGLEAGFPVVGGELVAFTVQEGAASFLHVHDLRDGSTVNLQQPDATPLAIRDDFVAFALAESSGLDLNQDGDETDLVFQLYDARLGAIHNTALALAGAGVRAAGGMWGIPVSEEQQGGADLSGDGEADAAVLFVYDPARTGSRNLGLALPAAWTSSADPERLLISALEVPSGADLNGDGDLDDAVVHVYEPALDRLVNTALASRSPAVLAGGWVGVSVSESMQGGSDLDQDGDADGDVVHAFDLVTERTVDLGVDSRLLFGAAEHLLLLPGEGDSGIDWDQDGDLEDSVLVAWNARLRSTANSKLATEGILGIAGDRALVLVSEASRQEDANEDGDREDLVLWFYDARSGEQVSTGLATLGPARLSRGGTAVVLVSEESQGADLNGDGDELDDVLHVVRP